MQQLTIQDLWSLEQYDQCRPEFRASVMRHKAGRNLRIGPHVTLYFEDQMTIRYQVQEMLRVEKIFQRAGIEDELAAYNPLIPDGDNWKATMMIEYTDAGERRGALEALVGIEHRVWMQIGDLPRIYAIADEDLERTRETKTSSVHFLRFQVPREQLRAVTRGRHALRAGIDHPHYRHQLDPLPEPVAQALWKDLEST